MMHEDDNHAFWMGYMLQTVKDVARRTHDQSCVDALRAFCDTSALAKDADREALEKALSDDDIYYDNYSRKVPDTPVLRLAGAFHCDPDESCGGAA